MKPIYLTLFFCTELILISCGIKKVTTDEAVPVYNFRLVANNLSEDFSNFSTKNDELSVHIYPFANDTISNQIKSIYHVFTADDQDTSFTITKLEGIDTLLFCFVEIDHNMVRGQAINDSICTHFTKIINAASRDDYLALDTWFGDDDFLFTIKVPIKVHSRKRTISFVGKHKLDRYSYKLQYWTN